MRSFYKDGNESTRGRERVKNVGYRSSVRRNIRCRETGY